MSTPNTTPETPTAGQPDDHRIQYCTTLGNVVTSADYQALAAQLAQARERADRAEHTAKIADESREEIIAQLAQAQGDRSRMVVEVERLRALIEGWTEAFFAKRQP